MIHNRININPVHWPIYVAICLSNITNEQYCFCESFVDRFDDGNAEDGVPLQWVPSPRLPGDYDASSGDYVFEPNDESGRFLAANVPDAILGDISIRARGTITEDRGNMIVSVRNQEVLDRQHYFGGSRLFRGGGWHCALPGTKRFFRRYNIIWSTSSSTV